MTKFILSLLMMTLSVTGLFAQEEAKADERIANVKKHAELCADAQMKMDTEKLAPYIPKKVIESMGGKEGLKEMLTQAIEQMKQQGVTIDKVKIGTPAEPQKYEEILAGLVPQEITMTTPQGKLVVDSHLLAVSEDDGATWVFIDSAGAADQKLGILYPSLKGRIKIPPMKPRQAN